MFTQPTNRTRPNPSCFGALRMRIRSLEGPLPVILTHRSQMRAISPYLYVMMRQIELKAAL